MQLQYFGLSSFKITTNKATVLTDPFNKTSGLTSPRASSDIVMLAESDNSLYSATEGLAGDPFIISDPGEYDVKGITGAGMPLKQGDNYVTAFLIESEDIKILNLTHIKEFTMTESELESLGEIDLLILPVGGHGVFEATTASKVVNEVEPKIVIPSHYNMDNLKVPADKLDKFIKEMGGKSETVDRLTLKKKDLIAEGTKLVIIEPLR